MIPPPGVATIPLQGSQIRRQGDIAFENDLGAGGGARRLDRGIEVGFTKDIVGKGRRDDQKRRKRSPAEQCRAPMRKRRLRRPPIHAHPDAPVVAGDCRLSCPRLPRGIGGRL